MKRFFAAVLILALLTLCGCGQIIPTGGTLELEADNIDHIQIINSTTGKSFSVVDRTDISTIIKHLNSYTLEDPQEPSNENRYNLSLVYRLQGGAELHIGVSDDTITHESSMYAVNAKALGQILEGLECATMTDQELIRYLFENDTIADLGITDDNGQISLDKIANLQNACPALFELLSRPTVVESIAAYGTDIMQEYINSTNAILREQAEAIANFLKETFPQLSDQIDQILGE